MLEGPKLGLLCLGSRPASRVVEIARYAEAAGFSAFWVPDERFFREVYSLCAAVAAASSTIRIGPCVTDPYTRHPVLTAMAIATLDELSGGRAVLGVGAGVSGFSELGLERRRPARAVRETVELVGEMLRGEPVEYRGEIFQYSGRLNFKPLRGAIPVYLAAGGPLMLRTAGAIADGVIIEACVAPGTLEAALAEVWRGAEAAGRNPGDIEIVPRIDVAVDESLDRAYDALRPRIARKLIAAGPSFEIFRRRGLDVPEGIRKRVAGGLGYTWDLAVLEEVGRDLPLEYLDAFFIAATPETVGERLGDLVARGGTALIVNPIPTSGDRVEAIVDAVASWRQRATSPAARD